MATMAIGRFAFASFAVSIATFFLGISIEPNPFSQTIFKVGAFLFSIHLVFLGAYLYETLLEPNEKIKRQEKIIEKLQKLRKK